MKQLKQYLESHKQEMVDLLARLVNIDSGSDYKPGIDICGRIAAEELKSLGFDVDVIQENSSGDHIFCRREGVGPARLLILTHLDTVWPEGTASARPYHLEGNNAYGPGVGDMKGGIVMMLYALKALFHQGIETVPLSVFLAGDEEKGSVRGRRYIEEEGRRSQWVFVMEGAVPPYSIVVERWGVGAFTLVLQGKAAHVLDPGRTGVNACKELAYKILALEEITDLERGIIVSVNRVRGGTARQVTAARVTADIDVRVKNPADMESVAAQVKKAATIPVIPGIRIVLEGGMTRPPMMPGKNTEELLDTILQVGTELGMELNPGKKAGGSDGSFTAAMGIPTIDGMGPLGYDMCSEQECIDLSSLVLRTCLLAESIRRLAH